MHNECDGYGNCMAHAFPLISEIHCPTNVHKTGRFGGMTKLMHLVNDKIRGVVQVIKMFKVPNANIGRLQMAHSTFDRNVERISTDAYKKPVSRWKQLEKDCDIDCE